MSGSSGGDAAAHGEVHVHPISFYVAIGAFLSILTLVELGPLFDWYNIPVFGLLALSAVKFLTVIAFFMHLWDDSKVYAQLFGYPLVGATLMIMVLMALFHTYSPSPLEDSFAVQERYWENHSGECSSWLVSHRTHRQYCASPGIETARLAAFLPADSATGGGAEDMKAFAALHTDEEKQKFLVEKGASVYASTCKACHGEAGQGVPGAFPPLAGAGEFYGTPENHARIIVHGLSGPITVLGQAYNGTMPPQGALSDLDIAAVATYERSSWGNADGMVTPDDVKRAR